MRVPPEILHQILRDMMETLPIKDLCRARLVNSFFADEIMSFLSTSPRLEIDGFGCQQGEEGRIRHQGHHRNKRDVPRWDAFPYHLKIRILRDRYRQGHRKENRANCCGFYRFITNLLDDLVQKRRLSSSEDREALAGKLIHGMALVCLQHHGIYCPEQLHTGMGCRHRGLVSGSIGERSRQYIERRGEVLLACEAIHRGDAGELEYMIGQGLIEVEPSTRWGSMVLEIGVRTGSADINRVLVRNSPTALLSNGRQTYVLSIAAQYNNYEALQVWIEDLKFRSNPDAWLCMDVVIRRTARMGRTDMIEFLINEYGYSEQELVYNALIMAIDHGHEKTVQRLLAREGFDPNITTAKFPKGLLFSAVCNCKPTTKRPVMVKMLLEQGADPRKAYPGMTKTLLQRALEKKDAETAAVLVEYGADVTTESLPRRSKGTKLLPVLLMATGLKDMGLVHLLVEKGVDRNFKWKGKMYTLRQEGRSIKGALGTLELDETNEKRPTANYVLVQTG